MNPTGSNRLKVHTRLHFIVRASPGTINKTLKADNHNSVLPFKDHVKKRKVSNTDDLSEEISRRRTGEGMSDDACSVLLLWTFSSVIPVEGR